MAHATRVKEVCASQSAQHKCIRQGAQGASRFGSRRHHVRSSHRSGGAGHELSAAAVTIAASAAVEAIDARGGPSVVGVQEEGTREVPRHDRKLIVHHEALRHAVLRAEAECTARTDRVRLCVRRRRDQVISGYIERASWNAAVDDARAASHGARIKARKQRHWRKPHHVGAAANKVREVRLRYYMYMYMLCMLCMLLCMLHQALVLFGPLVAVAQARPRGTLDRRACILRAQCLIRAEVLADEARWHLAETRVAVARHPFPQVLCLSAHDTVLVSPSHVGAVGAHRDAYDAQAPGHLGGGRVLRVCGAVAQERGHLRALTLEDRDDVGSPRFEDGVGGAAAVAAIALAADSAGEEEGDARASRRRSWWRRRGGHASVLRSQNKGATCFTAAARHNGVKAVVCCNK